MKATTLKNRLDKRYTGAKSSIAYKVLVDLIEDTNKTYRIQGINVPIIRPVYTSGTGRFTSNQDHTLAICKLLALLGIKYVSGNDSPRGGLTGNYIRILTKIEY